MADHKLNEIFSIPEKPNEQKTPEVYTHTPDVSEEVYKHEIDIVKRTQLDLIEKGKESLEELISVAKESESPRAWEVVSNLIKTTSDVANAFATLVQKEKTVQQEVAAQTNITTNNNTIYVGSTADLQKLIKEQK